MYFKTKGTHTPTDMVSRRKKNNRSKLYISAIVCIIALLTAGKSGYINRLHEILKTETAVANTEQTDRKAYPEGYETTSTKEQSPISGMEMPAPISNKPEIILKRTAYTVSYNIETKCPNYVAWSLYPERLQGDVKRTNNFTPDEEIDEAYRIETGDYRRSGYDRGHMCPAGDNTFSEKAMEESFLMTNICPQGHNLNAGDWNQLEEFCRELGMHQTVYIACGPIYDSKSPKRIGNRKKLKISVPDRFFKVLLILDDSPKAIGFIMPNDDTDKPLADYAVSVDSVEKATGIDFFTGLDDKTERHVESQCSPEQFGLN